jgi:hypothetical protein
MTTRAHASLVSKWSLSGASTGGAALPYAALKPLASYMTISRVDAMFVCLWRGCRCSIYLCRSPSLSSLPLSVKHKYEGEWKDPAGSKAGTALSTCTDSNRVSRSMEPQGIDGGGEVIFTYDVTWEESDIAWSRRWNLYLQGGSGDDDIHWFSIVNSLMIVLFLTVRVSSSFSLLPSSSSAPTSSSPSSSSLRE